MKESKNCLKENKHKKGPEIRFLFYLCLLLFFELLSERLLPYFLYLKRSIFFDKSIIIITTPKTIIPFK